MNLDMLQPWEKLMKQIVWQQMGEIKNKKVLDFGSGIGVTADYLAKHNEVVAIEPNEESVNLRWQENSYQQITGNVKNLKDFQDEIFDVIVCHNVFEYAKEERVEIINEFARLLKKDGVISLVKHNRPGRVMQMVVLLNDFESANSLLDGEDGMTSKFGAIQYYDDLDIYTIKEYANEYPYLFRYAVIQFLHLIATEMVEQV